MRNLEPVAPLPESTPIALKGLDREQRFLGRSGALLLFVSLLSGFFVAAAMTGQVPADGRIAVAAHVSGLLGSLFLFAYAWSLPMLRYGPTGRTRIAWALIVGNFANLLIGSAKAFPAVHGITLTESVPNNVVFGLLTLMVVLPMLVASGAWVYGFRK